MSDSIYRLRAFDVLTLLVLALLAVGVIMVQSASQGVSGHMGFHLTDLGQKQLVFSALGVAIYFVCSRVDYGPPAATQPLGVGVRAAVAVTDRRRGVRGGAGSARRHRT